MSVHLGRSIKRHLYWAMKNCGGDPNILQQMALNIPNHYKVMSSPITVLTSNCSYRVIILTVMPRLPVIWLPIYPVVLRSPTRRQKRSSFGASRLPTIQPSVVADLLVEAYSLFWQNISHENATGPTWLDKIITKMYLNIFLRVFIRTRMWIVPTPVWVRFETFAVLTGVLPWKLSWERLFILWIHFG